MVTFLEVRVYFFVAETLDALTSAIHSSCEQQHLRLETSGVDRLCVATDWITLSPKRHRTPRLEVVQACHELKVVVHEPADLLFAEVVAAQAPQAHWLLQPGWESEKGQQLAFDYAKSNGRWRLSLQTHKWLKVR